MSKPTPLVLIATDFSPGSEAALRGFEGLWPKGGRVRIQLVHVIEPIVVVAAPAPTASWDSYEEDRGREARTALERLARRITKRVAPVGKVQTLVPIGSAHAQICKVAKKLNADLVVVGTHGRTGLRHVLIGSVAERVVRHAGRPVLAIPARRS